MVNKVDFKNSICEWEYLGSDITLTIDKALGNFSFEGENRHYMSRLSLFGGKEIFSIE